MFRDESLEEIVGRIYVTALFDDNNAVEPR